NVYLRSESGETLDSCLDPLGLVPKLLRHFDLSGTVCLRFVDPYGDTVFNYLQAPVLLGELAGIRPRLDDRTRALIDALIPGAERPRFNLCGTGSGSVVPRITAMPAAQICGRHSLPERYGVYPLPWLAWPQPS